MGDLAAMAAFANARLDEREAAAKAATADLAADRLDWSGFVQTLWKSSLFNEDDDICDYLDLCGPDSALGEVEHIRAIVSDCVRALRFPENSPLASLARRTLSSLGAIWDRHPDYCPIFGHPTSVMEDDGWWRCPCGEREERLS